MRAGHCDVPFVRPILRAGKTLHGTVYVYSSTCRAIAGAPWPVWLRLTRRKAPRNVQQEMDKKMWIRQFRFVVPTFGARKLFKLLRVTGIELGRKLETKKGRFGAVSQISVSSFATDVLQLRSRASIACDWQIGPAPWL